MEPLSEELAEECWQEINSLTEDEAYEDSIAVSKRQPHIVAFIVELTEDLDDDMRELAIFEFFVVYHMFEKGYGRNIEQVGSDELIHALEENERLMESMKGDDEEFYEEVAKFQMSSQPFIIRYVVETLFAESQEENPVLLGEEDVGFLFLILKTIIDVLNVKTNV